MMTILASSTRGISLCCQNNKVIGSFNEKRLHNNNVKKKVAKKGQKIPSISQGE